MESKDDDDDKKTKSKDKFRSGIFYPNVYTISETHARMKKVDGMYPCFIEGCDKKYKKDYSLSCHLNIRHLNLKPYKCPYCDYANGSDLNTRQHVKLCLKKPKLDASVTSVESDTSADRESIDSFTEYTIIDETNMFEPPVTIVAKDSNSPTSTIATHETADQDENNLDISRIVHPNEENTIVITSDRNENWDSANDWIVIFDKSNLDNSSLDPIATNDDPENNDAEDLNESVSKRKGNAWSGIYYPKFQSLSETHAKMKKVNGMWPCFIEGCDKVYKKEEGLSCHLNVAHVFIEPYKCPHCDFRHAFPIRVRKHIKTSCPNYQGQTGVDLDNTMSLENETVTTFRETDDHDATMYLNETLDATLEPCAPQSEKDPLARSMEADATIFLNETLDDSLEHGSPQSKEVPRSNPTNAAVGAEVKGSEELIEKNGKLTYPKYSTLSTLHAQIKEIGGVFPCPIKDCMRTYNDPDSLAGHLNVKHLKMKPYKCPNCDYRQGNLHYLKKHFELKCRKHSRESSKSESSSESNESNATIDTTNAAEDVNDKSHVTEDFPIQPNDHLSTPTKNNNPGLLDTCVTLSSKKKKPAPSGIYYPNFYEMSETHAKIKKIDGKFPCPAEDCNEIYKALEGVASHLNVTHLKIKPYECPHCGVKGARAAPMRTHVRNNCPKNPNRQLSLNSKETNCEDLNTSGWEDDIIPHPEIQSPRPKRDLSSDLNDQFDTKVYARKSGAKRKTSNSPSSTPLAKKSTSSCVQALESPQKMNQCPDCPFQSDKTSDIQDHYNEAHADNEENDDNDDWNCPECTESLFDAKELLVHLRIHFRKKSFLAEVSEYWCVHCELILKTKNKAKRHAVKIHGQALQTLRHSGQVIEEVFQQCRNCQETFVNISSAKEHLRACYEPGKAQRPEIPPDNLGFRRRGADTRRAGGGRLSPGRVSAFPLRRVRHGI